MSIICHHHITQLPYHPHFFSFTLMKGWNTPSSSNLHRSVGYDQDYEYIHQAKYKNAIMALTFTDIPHKNLIAHIYTLLEAL